MTATLNTAFCVVLSVCAVIARGQTWEQRSTPVSFAGRVLHGQAHDHASGHTVLFGGMRTGTTPDAETWLWNGTAWTQASSAVAPSARWGHAMAYDAVRGRIVLFGGITGWGNEHNDTWTWDGASWHLETSTVQPSPRGGSSMAFDANLGRIVLFGGIGGGTVHGDTWWWDGADWLPIFTAVAPSPRHGHATSYDPVRGRLVLFGGRGATQPFLGDLHEWDGAQWLMAQPPASPSPRFHHAMAFDAVSRRCILTGGNDGQPCADTWSWDGTTWTELVVSGPSPRYQAAASFDRRSARMVLTGGGDGATLLEETWQFASTPATPIAAASVFGVGCATPPLTIAPAEGSRPLLGGQQSTVVGNLLIQPCVMAIGASSSHADAVLLPLSLTPFGFTGCRLYHDLAIGADACATTGPTLALHTLAIPMLPALVGQHAYLQAIALAPTANPAGLVTSNAVDLLLSDI